MSSVDEPAPDPDEAKRQQSVDDLVALALLNLSHGEFDHAEPLLLRALEIQQKMLGKTHALCGPTLKYLADLYWGKGDLTRCVSYLVPALDFYPRVISAENEVYATELMRLGQVYLQLDDCARGERAFQQA